MELELLNDQLKKGQGEAERKAKSERAASDATRADVQRVSQRLKAMPKRFTQSLPSLRDEVDSLEREKLSLELAKQQTTLKVNPCDSQNFLSRDGTARFLPRHTGNLVYD